ncbi:hypothetical protein ACP4OV_028754 [Aristida adscensionis]
MARTKHQAVRSSRTPPKKKLQFAAGSPGERPSPSEPGGASTSGTARRGSRAGRGATVAVWQDDGQCTILPCGVVVLILEFLTSGCVLGGAEALRRKEKGAKKPHRWKPGTVALREIRKFQKSCRTLIPFVPFVRVVREISNQLAPDVKRWTPGALLGLQEAAEYHVVGMFEMANLCAIHAKRVTITCRRTYNSQGALGEGIGDKNNQRRNL